MATPTLAEDCNDRPAISTGAPSAAHATGNPFDFLVGPHVLDQGHEFVAAVTGHEIRGTNARSQTLRKRF